MAQFMVPKSESVPIRRCPLYASMTNARDGIKPFLLGEKVKLSGAAYWLVGQSSRSQTDVNFAMQELGRER